jgi:flagellar assembly protein FliH
LSDAAVSYAFEQLEPSEPPPRDGAERTLAQARAQAQEIREQARVEGYEQGQAQGIADGRAQLASALAALEQAHADLLAMRGEIAEEVERDAVELGMALAGKIVTATLQIRPELVLEVVQGGLRRITGQRSISILVNPADLETLRGALGDLRQTGATAEHWDLQPDQRVQAGGAILRTGEGEIDVQPDTQLERAYEVVQAEIGPRKKKSS